MRNTIIEKNKRLCFDELANGYVMENSWLLECSNGHIFRINSIKNLKNHFLINEKCPKCINNAYNTTIPITSLSVEEALEKIDRRAKKGKTILEEDIKITESDYEIWHKENLEILDCVFIKHPLISTLLHANDTMIKAGISETVDMRIRRIKQNVRNELNKIELIKITIKDLIQER